MSRGSDALVLALSGHLTDNTLGERLRSLEVAPGRVLIVDCTAMTGYDNAARERFVAWHRVHRDRIRAVAVVTPNTLWHMLVGAMSLASGQRMRAFETRTAAEAWLASC